MAAEGDLLGLGGDFGEAPAPNAGADEADAPSGALAQLLAMFPTVDRAVVEMVLSDVDGDAERATEALLNITDDSVDPAAVVAEASQDNSDEMLALQMLQQMMNEEDTAKADADKVFRQIQQNTERKEAFKNTPKGAGMRAALLRARACRLHHPRTRALTRSALGSRARPLLSVGVKEAFVRNLEKMKAKAMGIKKGESGPSKRYGALLEEDDPAMKV